MKYAPKKVFILENGNYKEISYEDHRKLQTTDKKYVDKLFLLLHGILMEVTEETYRTYHKTKRRQKYIDECSYKNKDFSYDSLDTEEMLGEDIFADRDTDVEKQVEDKIMIEKLRQVFRLLSSEEKRLLILHFFKGKSQTELSRLYGLNQSNISRKIDRILAKLKKFLEN